MDNIKSIHSAEDLHVMLENKINATNESIEKKRVAAKKAKLTESRKIFI